jgi:hypothetical protein
MSYISPAELSEIVPDLRAMAAVETVPDVRAALLRVADRYAAPVTLVPRPDSRSLYHDDMDR